MRLKLICAFAAVLAMGTAATAALAARPGAGSCTGTAAAPGFVAGGTYSGLTITGTCFFVQGADITIDGNLTVAPGASLNAHATPATAASVHVTGNVLVGKGGTVGLGEYQNEGPYVPQTTVVDGNITADQPQTLYLSEMTVHGNIVSHGGSGPGLNFPLKDLIVGGNVDLSGWSGLWIGLFRSHVGGNVIFSHNTGNGVSRETGTPDSSEVADNSVFGNLICHGNDPSAQLGDSGGGPNTVGGQAIGECATLTQAP